VSLLLKDSFEHDIRWVEGKGLSANQYHLDLHDLSHISIIIGTCYKRLFIREVTCIGRSLGNHLDVVKHVIFSRSLGNYLDVVKNVLFPRSLGNHLDVVKNVCQGSR